MARQLLHRKNLRVLTNAVNIGMELSSSAKLETTLTGGNLRWAGAFSLVGPTAIESLAVVVMDRLFLSVTGVGCGTRPRPLFRRKEAAVFRAMVRQTRQGGRSCGLKQDGAGKSSGNLPAAGDRPADYRRRISEEAAGAFAASGVRVLIV